MGKTIPIPETMLQAFMPCFIRISSAQVLVTKTLSKIFSLSTAIPESLSVSKCINPQFLIFFFFCNAKYSAWKTVKLIAANSLGL